MGTLFHVISEALKPVELHKYRQYCKNTVFNVFKIHCSWVLFMWQEATDDNLDTNSAGKVDDEENSQKEQVEFHLSRLTVKSFFCFSLNLKQPSINQCYRLGTMCGFFNKQFRRTNGKVNSYECKIVIGIFLWLFWVFQGLVRISFCMSTCELQQILSDKIWLRVVSTRCLDEGIIRSQNLGRQK